MLRGVSAQGHCVGCRVVRVATSKEDERLRLIHDRPPLSAILSALRVRSVGMFGVAGAGSRGKLGWRKNRPQIGVRLSTPHEMTRTRTLGDGVEEWSCTR